MLSKKKSSHQLSLFNELGDILNQKHPLYKLAGKINWHCFDESFAKHYCSDNGRPAKPIRLMCALIILKHLRNVSDENIVEQWSENIYYQYFSGESKFVSTYPCVPTELIAFRDRIGEEGLEIIFRESIRINDDETPMDKNNLVVSVDTTVQEKNITYPTDDKQYKKIITKCWKIANEYDIKLRRTYGKEYKTLCIAQRFKNSSRGRKNARKANGRVKTIAGVLVRELNRKLPLEGLGKYLQLIKLYTQVLHQKRGDSNKIYSLHEKDVKCFAKGKAHKKFEFGSKVSVAIDQQTGIIVAAYNITLTQHDSKTIPDVIEQCERMIDVVPKEAFVDRGYRGINKYKECAICVPKTDNKITKEKRQKHSKRAAIEPVIGHLKKNYRLCRNYYKGIKGDIMNILLSAIAMNFKRVMNLWKKEANLIEKLIKIYSLCFLEILCPKKYNRVFEG